MNWSQTVTGEEFETLRSKISTAKFAKDCVNPKVFHHELIEEVNAAPMRQIGFVK